MSSESVEQREGDLLLVKQHLSLMAALIVDLDIEGYLRAISRAQDFGPFFDPTAWMANTDGLRRGETLARGALEFQKAVLTLRAAGMQIGIAHDDQS